MPSSMRGGSPFLYDSVTGRIIGIKGSDGSDTYFDYGPRASTSVYMRPGSPYLFDGSTNRIVGVKNPDGSEYYFASGTRTATSVFQRPGSPILHDVATGRAVGVKQPDGSETYFNIFAAPDSDTSTGGSATTGAIVGDRVRFPTATGALANLSASQIAHTAPVAGAISQLVFTDVWYYLTDVFTVSPMAAPLTFTKFVEYPVGVFTPVTWSGGTLTFGTLNTTVRNLTSDPVAVTIPAGATWWEHTINTAGSVNWPLRELPALASTLGVLDGKYTAADATTPAHQVAGQASATSFGAALITGTVAAAGYKAPVVIGDSIAYGEGDITSTSAKGGSGYLGRALDTLGTGYALFAKRGMSASDFATILNAGSPTLNPFIVLLNAACSHVIVQPGVNDLRLGRTGVQLLADHQTIYSKFPGKVIGQTTLTPRTSSTDSWATTANQTVRVDGQWPDLTSVNTAIRALPAGVTFLVEAADAAMSARDSGVWKAPPAATTDGTHPNSTVCASMAAAIPLTLP